MDPNIWQYVNCMVDSVNLMEIFYCQPILSQNNCGVMVMNQVDPKHERVLQVANNLIGYTVLLALCPFVAFLASQYGYLDREIQMDIRSLKSC